MRAGFFIIASTAAVLGVSAACNVTVDDAGASGSSSGSSGAADASTASSSGSSGGTSSGDPASSTSSSSSSSGASGDGGSSWDPTKAGPFTTATSDATVAATQTTEELSIRAVVPQGAGPFPVVILAPGFQIGANAYTEYATRLASHGVATLLVDYPGGFTDGNVLLDSKNLSAALAWAKAPGGALAGKLDATKAGVMGHSRGGKAAVLAAVADAGFKALLALDPVDSKPPIGCNETTECPDASNAITKLKVPFLVLGETLDASGSFQNCAPAADNYTTFYASAPSPAIEVTVNGASHTQFVPDQQSCGFVCSACKTPTRALSDVVGISSAYAVAFFRKHLAAESGWDTFLTGSDAQAKWVTPGVATIRSK